MQERSGIVVGKVGIIESKVEVAGLIIQGTWCVGIDGFRVSPPRLDDRRVVFDAVKMLDVM